MTKAQRAKAMAQVIQACARHKDKKPLAEAVRKIVADLLAEEAAHREQAAVESERNRIKNDAAPKVTKDRRFAPEVGNAIKAMSDEDFRRLEGVIVAHIDTGMAVREVPELSPEAIALHTGMRKSGRFTVENAAKLYQKPDEPKT